MRGYRNKDSADAGLLLRAGLGAARNRLGFVGRFGDLGRRLLGAFGVLGYGRKGLFGEFGHLNGGCRIANEVRRRFCLRGICPRLFEGCARLGIFQSLGERVSERRHRLRVTRNRPFDRLLGGFRFCPLAAGSGRLAFRQTKLLANIVGVVDDLAVAVEDEAHGFGIAARLTQA